MQPLISRKVFKLFKKSTIFSGILSRSSIKIIVLPFGDFSARSFILFLNSSILVTRSITVFASLLDHSVNGFVFLLLLNTFKMPPVEILPWEYVCSTTSVEKRNIFRINSVLSISSLKSASTTLIINGIHSFSSFPYSQELKNIVS